jgi:hypothetical protein
MRRPSRKPMRLRMAQKFVDLAVAFEDFDDALKLSACGGHRCVAANAIGA